MAERLTRLDRPRLHPLMRERCTVIAAALPFVYSRSGEYAHRLRSAVIHTTLGKSHAAFQCWCGMTLLSKSARLSADTGSRPVCATCEGRVIGAGRFGERKIGERDVIYRPCKEVPRG